MFVFFGTIGGVGSGIYLDRTMKYLFALKVIVVCTTITMIASSYLILTGTMWGAMIFCFIGGFALVPIMPVCFSLATESTHPVQPALVIGLLMSGA